MLHCSTIVHCLSLDFKSVLIYDTDIRIYTDDTDNTDTDSISIICIIRTISISVSYFLCPKRTNKPVIWPLQA